ncbi:hypothetical protein V1J52_11140 [Streptomyces sp. TRM 70351]|uniref:hypothetical protein n=1 Tax=Streptomyces sp. TRM 70351 TaxID=3116552 RepID=UPI002E7C0C78|nr:hypothetical protein [Streptomyces sp. TRM 70351]MEE1928744.1 hypothetical protein [Streptomyces sp. TRM 70351]
MGWTVLYIAFGVVALWLLGEVLLQYKARLRWRLTAFFGFLTVVIGVVLPSLALIAAGTVAFGIGQTFVTLSFRRGFDHGWALETSRGRRGRKAPREADDGPPARPADAPPGLEVSGLEVSGPEHATAYRTEPVPDDTGGYGVYQRSGDGDGGGYADPYAYAYQGQEQGQDGGGYADRGGYQDQGGYEGRDGGHADQGRDGGGHQDPYQGHQGQYADPYQGHHQGGGQDAYPDPYGQPYAAGYGGYQGTYPDPYGTSGATGEEEQHHYAASPDHGTPYAAYTDPYTGGGQPSGPGHGQDPYAAPAAYAPHPGGQDTSDPYGFPGAGGHGERQGGYGVYAAGGYDAYGYPADAYAEPSGPGQTPPGGVWVPQPRDPDPQHQPYPYGDSAPDPQRY